MPVWVLQVPRWLVWHRLRQPAGRRAMDAWWVSECCAGTGVGQGRYDAQCTATAAGKRCHYTALQGVTSSWIGCIAPTERFCSPCGFLSCTCSPHRHGGRGAALAEALCAHPCGTRPQARGHPQAPPDLCVRPASHLQLRLSSGVCEIGPWVKMEPGSGAGGSLGGCCCQLGCFPLPRVRLRGCLPHHTHHHTVLQSS